MTAHDKGLLATPDPHGQAALMLCESVVHLLVEKGLLDREEVAEAIEGVIGIKHEMAGHEESVAASEAAIGLLSTVIISLRAG